MAVGARLRIRAIELVCDAERSERAVCIPRQIPRNRLRTHIVFVLVEPPSIGIECENI